MIRPDVAQAVDQLAEQGYTVFERLYDDAETAFFRDPLVRHYEALGQPVTYANPPVEPDESIEISRVGLVFHKLLQHQPAFAPVLFKPTVLETLRAFLGQQMHLEYTSAVLCHDDRPFFRWHMHVGGIDNIHYRKRQIYPTFERSERVTTLLYLDDLDDASGTLLVRPRRITDPTTPPGDREIVDWPGQVELALPRGSFVVLEQNTWHAARAKRSRGVRGFIACYFASALAPPTSDHDASALAWNRDFGRSA